MVTHVCTTATHLRVALPLAAEAAPRGHHPYAHPLEYGMYAHWTPPSPPQCSYAVHRNGSSGTGTASSQLAWTTDDGPRSHRGRASGEAHLVGSATPKRTGVFRLWTQPTEVRTHRSTMVDSILRNRSFPNQNGGRSSIGDPKEVHTVPVRFG